MAITTLSGVISGLYPPNGVAKLGAGTTTAGMPSSLWYIGGNPAVGVADIATAGGVARTSPTTGQIIFPSSPGSVYLARLSAQNIVSGSLLLCDRLWDCGANSGGTQLSATLTTAQTINSATWPTRDSGNASAGADVYIGMEAGTSLGANTPTLTLGYTNSAGTSGLTATNVVPVSNHSLGAFYMFGLNAGDVGVKSVQSFTLSSTFGLGTIVLVAFRVLAILDLSVISGRTTSIDAITSAFPKLFPGSVPFIMSIGPASTSNLSANVQFAAA